MRFVAALVVYLLWLTSAAIAHGRFRCRMEFASPAGYWGEDNEVAVDEEELNADLLANVASPSQPSGEAKASAEPLAVGGGGAGVAAGSDGARRMSDSVPADLPYGSSSSSAAPAAAPQSQLQQSQQQQAPAAPGGPAPKLRASPAQVSNAQAQRSNAQNARARHQFRQQADTNVVAIKFASLAKSAENVFAGDAVLCKCVASL